MTAAASISTVTTAPFVMRTEGQRGMLFSPKSLLSGGVPQLQLDSDAARAKLEQPGEEIRPDGRLRRVLHPGVGEVAQQGRLADRAVPDDDHPELIVEEDPETRGGYARHLHPINARLIALFTTKNIDILLSNDVYNKRNRKLCGI